MDLRSAATRQEKVIAATRPGRGSGQNSHLRPTGSRQRTSKATERRGQPAELPRQWGLATAGSGGPLHRWRPPRDLASKAPKTRKWSHQMSARASIKSPVEAPAGLAAPRPDVAVSLRAVSKVYGRSGTTVRGSERGEHRLPSRLIHCRHGPVRVGQKHAVALRRRPGPPDHGSSMARRP